MEKKKMLTGNLFVPVVLLTLIGSLTQTIGKAVGYTLLYVILIDPILSRLVSYRAIKTAFSTATLFSAVFALIGKLIGFSLLANSFPVVWLLTFVMVFVHASRSFKIEDSETETTFEHTVNQEINKEPINPEDFTYRPQTKL